MAQAAEQTNSPTLTKTPTSASSTKRSKRCPGCHTSHQEHSFGIPGPHCAGPTTSPHRNSSTILTDEDARSRHPHERSGDNSNVDFYKQQLALLNQEEERLLADINSEENRLLREIEEKKREIQRLKASKQRQTSSSLSRRPNAPQAAMFPSLFDDAAPRVSPPNNHTSPLVADARNHVSNPHMNSGNVDELAGENCGRIGAGNVVGGRNANVVSGFDVNNSDIFLRPSRLVTDGTRGKPLRIVDFVSRACPSEEERILSYDMKYCKLSLTLNDSKPKLKDITISQFNIANYRIFYELFFF